MHIQGIEVIDHDSALWVLNKPAGLLSAPGRGPDKQDSLMSRMQAHDPAALQVHRLDQATSGLMLMARTAEAQRRLQAAFALRRTQKIYIAVVQGLPPEQPEWQSIDAPIALNWPDRPRHHVGDGGKPSQTWWRVLAQNTALGRSLLALRPVTGRSHQLRVHLAWKGWPILGDALYAPPAIAQTCPRLALHAWRLGIEHPISGDNRVWECPCPAELGSEFCQQTVAQGLHNMSIPIQPGDCNA